VGSDNYWSAYPGDGSDKNLKFGCTIHQRAELCQLQAFRQKATGTADYLLLIGGLFRPIIELLQLIGRAVQANYPLGSKAKREQKQKGTGNFCLDRPCILQLASG
jgi:hypothetical protein